VLLAAGRRYHPHLTVLHASRSTSPCSGAGRRAACGGEGCPHAIGPSLGKCSPCDRTGPPISCIQPDSNRSGVFFFFGTSDKSYVAQKAKTRVASVKLSPSTPLRRPCVSFVLPVESRLPDSALGTSAASHLALAGLQHRRHGGRRGRELARGRVPKRPWCRAN